MLIAALLLAQSASALPLVPGRDDRDEPAQGAARNCSRNQEDIVVCAPAPSRYVPRPPLPQDIRFRAAGADGTVDAVERGIAPGVAVPALLVKLSWPF